MPSAAELIRPQLAVDLPTKALVLGSGLAQIGEQFAPHQRISYDRLAAFPSLGVGGHSGELLIARTPGCNLLVIKGRSHYYESGDIRAMAGVLDCLQQLGCQHLLLTNAAGSLVADCPPGGLMLIEDHINWAGLSPLIGVRDDSRFVDMGAAYDPEQRELLSACARRLDIRLAAGVYVFFPGPQFETPAEIRAAKVLGGSAVGMSTVPEAILARFHGISVSAISIITNMAAGLSSERLSQQHTLSMAQRAHSDLSRLLEGYYS